MAQDPGAVYRASTDGVSRAGESVFQRLSLSPGLPAHIALTSGIVHNSEAEAPSASGSIEPLRSVSHAPTKVETSPIA